jgi:hypothetical protein
MMRRAQAGLSDGAAAAAAAAAAEAYADARFCIRTASAGALDLIRRCLLGRIRRCLPCSKEQEGVPVREATLRQDTLPQTCTLASIQTASAAAADVLQHQHLIGRSFGSHPQVLVGTHPQGLPSSKEQEGVHAREATLPHIYKYTNTQGLSGPEVQMIEETEVFVKLRYIQI